MDKIRELIQGLRQEARDKIGDYDRDVQIEDLYEWQAADTMEAMLEVVTAAENGKVHIGFHSHGWARDLIDALEKLKETE